MKKKLISILILIIIIQITKQYKCEVQQNMYVYWGDINEQSPKNITYFTLRTPITNGYSSITFHDNQNNFKDSVTFFSNKLLQNLKILKGDSLTKNFTNNETNIIGYMNFDNFTREGDDFFGFSRNFLTIYFNDTKEIEKKKFMTIKYQENNILKEFTLNFNFHKKTFCYLAHVDNIDLIHPSLTVIKGNF
jgi:hypothetical protein